MTSAEPLLNPYLWALGKPAIALPPGTEVAGRYRVIAPQVWLDTQPDRPIEATEDLHRELLPYLYLYPQRLHVPIVYDVRSLAEGTVVLLENTPLEGAGSLQPSFQESLGTASALRQVNWFWQILQLWPSLAQLGVAASLLVPDNLRVEGWRVRLRELYAALGEDAPLGAGLDERRYTETTLRQPDLRQLGQCWGEWAQRAQGTVRASLVALGEQLCAPEANYEAIAAQLNILLLRQTAQNPMRLQVAGLSDPGPTYRNNEDSCYPSPTDLRDRGIPPHSTLIPHVAIVCDGLGGHEGGEVASQLALRTLLMQLQALFGEVRDQTQPLPPNLIIQQLSASVRVVNNLIASKNNEQGREARQRMGTTLVMAVHLQQPIAPDSPPAHEIYLVNVGDSRAYWITNRHCQSLSVDDDVACRETRLGRSLYRAALQRSDAGALTQALGTRDGEQLHTTIQRLVFDEDGLLLLCSDGLSDNGRVEQSWAETVAPVLTGAQSLEAAVQQWVTLANSLNGHDNVSVVLSRCRISPEYPVLLGSESAMEATQTPAESLTEASEALLASLAQAEPAADAPSPKRGGWLLKLLGTAAVLALGGTVGYVAYQQLRPNPQPTPLPSGLPSGLPSSLPSPGSTLPGNPTTPSVPSPIVPSPDAPSPDEGESGNPSADTAPSDPSAPETGSPETGNSDAGSSETGSSETGSPDALESDPTDPEPAASDSLDTAPAPP